MRKLIIALVLLLGVYLLISRFAEIQEIADILRHGKIGFILLALGVQLIWVGVVGLTYRSIYDALGMPARRILMTQVATAATFVNVVAPTGGLSGVALFISNARIQGHSAAKVTVASVLFLWFEYGATLVMLTIGLGEMARRNNLHWSEIAASLILLAGALGIGILLYLGMISANLLGRILAGSARRINVVVGLFIRRDYLSIARAHSFAAELAEGISALQAQPLSLIRPVLLALLNKFILVGILALSFQAFNVKLSLITLVAGFSISYLFLIVSPTPAGIGIVEGVMTIALHSLEVPIGSAAVITLAYRGVTFWFHLLLGMIAFRSLPNKPQI